MLEPLSVLSPSAPLILGSGSPRRREILAAAEVPFVVVTGDADESVQAGEEPEAYLARVVLAKLAAVRARARVAAPSSSAILVADTSVIDRGGILGKPADDEEGLAMVERLAGRTHDVRTRFALADARGDGPPLVARTIVSRVTFRALAREEARAYVATGEGRDKAGGYAAQGLAAAFVARIDGSYTNVVGLPSDEVVAALRSVGLLR